MIKRKKGFQFKWGFSSKILFQKANLIKKNNFHDAIAFYKSINRKFYILNFNQNSNSYFIDDSSCYDVVSIKKIKLKCFFLSSKNNSKTLEKNQL